MKPNLNTAAHRRAAELAQLRRRYVQASPRSNDRTVIAEQMKPLMVRQLQFENREDRRSAS